MHEEKWKPSVTVAAVIERDGRFLLVEEETSDGLRLNQPAGHLEAGETLLAACTREVLEETACAFAATALLGVYQWRKPQRDLSFLRFAFSGEVGERIAGAKLDVGIVRTLWLTPDEIAASAERHRSPLVARCVDDYLAGRRLPLEALCWLD